MGLDYQTRGPTINDTQQWLYSKGITQYYTVNIWFSMSKKLWRKKIIARLYKFIKTCIDLEKILGIIIFIIIIKLGFLNLNFLGIKKKKYIVSDIL